MTTRRAKQLIYGTLYAIIWLVILAVIYFLFVRPLTNGPVATQCTVNTCAPTSTLPITTSALSIFVTSSGHYTFLAQALNTDPDFGAAALNYQVNLYDASNDLIESVPAQTFIYQGQNKSLVVPNVAVSQAVDHATIQMISAEWLASSTLGAIPQFDPQNLQTSTSSDNVVVSGQFTNSNIGSFEQIIVTVIFKDANRNPIGASQTELDNVEPQSTSNFSVMYPAENNIDPTQDQIIIYAIR